MTLAQVTGVIATQRRPRPRTRATYTPAPRGYGTCSLLTNWARTSWPGTSSRKTRTRLPGFCRYLRSLYPPEVRIAIICDNFSPPRTTTRDSKPAARPALSRAANSSPTPCAARNNPQAPAAIAGPARITRRRPR